MSRERTTPDGAQASERAEQAPRSCEPQDGAEPGWLTAVLNSMADEVYFTDPQKRYTYANPAALREFGHEAVDGQRVEDVVSGLEVLRPDGTPRPLSEAPPIRALRGEIIREEEQIVRTPRSGELRHRQVNAAPVRNAAGEIVGSVSVVRDITERKRFEAALAADLRDMALLRDLASRVIGPGDAKRLFGEILDAAIRIVKADAGTIQLLDETARELVLTETRGFDAAMMRRFARIDASSHSSCGRALGSGERQFVVFDAPGADDPDGTLRAHVDAGLACAQSTPLLSRSGRVLGMFSTHWRQRRSLDERETRFLDLLGRQAADLVERMQSDQALRQRERDLLDADRRKDEFIAMLSHELRNPLVPIRSGIELLKQARESPGLLDTLRPMMERQIAHMVRLIDDLLDVARISAGRIELRRAATGLSAIVTNAVESQRAKIEAAGVTLGVELPEADIVLDVDATRLSQVIANLVHNAAKFTPPGGTIQVSASRVVDRIELRVVDSGIGIAPERLPKIFDLFAPSGTKEPQEGGLGVGLALARRLVEMHGGQLEARSGGVNRGAEFIVRLPVPEAAKPSTGSTPTPASRLVNQRVLIVDDNEDAADSMSMLVEFAGGTTRVAYSAAAALELIDVFTPSVVLLDIGMPGMDGYEACRRIRAKYGDAIAVVAVSGWGQQSDKDFAARAGFDAHLTKPADPESLTAIIARLGR